MMSPPKQNKHSPRACGPATSTKMGSRLRARRWIHSFVTRGKRVSVRRQADMSLGGGSGAAANWQERSPQTRALQQKQNTGAVGLQWSTTPPTPPLTPRPLRQKG
ncbi:unnamed protein product, partial [Ectocarpus sp. 6 AP-2014]